MALRLSDSLQQNDNNDDEESRTPKVLNLPAPMLHFAIPTQSPQHSIPANSEISQPSLVKFNPFLVHGNSGALAHYPHRPQVRKLPHQILPAPDIYVSFSYYQVAYGSFSLNQDLSWLGPLTGDMTQTFVLELSKSSIARFFFFFGSRCCFPRHFLLDIEVLRGTKRLL